MAPPPSGNRILEAMQFQITTRVDRVPELATAS